VSGKRIGFLIFDNVMALDLVGPMDAFATANALAGTNGDRYYELITIGLGPKPIVCGSGMRFSPDTTIRDAPPLDTLILPGGEGLRRQEIERRLSLWLRSRARETRRIVSVCTGIYALAAAGLLDHRNVTTHWRFAAQFARQFPKLKVNADALFVKDGPFYTSAGVTAGIDLALALIEEDYGPHLALTVARDLVVYLKRPGGQDQFSQPLKFQVQSTDRFADLAGWIATHLSADLSEEALARRVGYSPRHFRRLFRESFGTSPARFIEQMRLNEARSRLAIPRNTVESVAESLGFRSRHVFSRAFERQFGLLPRIYRQSFHCPAEGL
jgi:transcriptional regulator GlxA family with amidase domain